MRDGKQTKQSPLDIQHVLRRAEVLKGLDDAGYRGLAQGASVQSYAAGSMVLFPGVDDDWSVLLDSGILHGYRMSEANTMHEAGKRSTLYLCLAGEILVAGWRDTYVDAVTSDTIACRVPRRQVARLLDGYPEVRARIERVTQERIDGVCDLVQDMTCENMFGRLGHALVQLTRHDGESVPLSRDMLGGLAHMSRPNVTDCLYCFLDQQWIWFVPNSHHGVDVLDRATLARAGSQGMVVMN